MELKPCPLCGGNAGYDKSHKISCRNCGVSVEKWADNCKSSNKQEVKELWNTRPQNQKLTEALEEIVGMDEMNYEAECKAKSIVQQALDEVNNNE